MNKLRLILPAVAILFAVAGGWVTNAAPKVVAAVDVSINQTFCERSGKCTEGGDATCQSTAPGTPPLYRVQATPCPAYLTNGTWAP